MMKKLFLWEKKFVKSGLKGIDPDVEDIIEEVRRRGK